MGDLEIKGRVLLGTLLVYLQKLAVFLRLKPYLYINMPNYWRRGIYVDHDLIKKLEEQSDLTICFVEGEESEVKKDLLRVAKHLSKKYKVFAYEYSPEVGGGAEDEAIRFITSLPYQPALVFIGTLLAEVAVQEMIHQAVEIWKESRKKEPEFVIKRVVDDIELVYIFDGLTAEQAISASKSILVDSKDRITSLVNNTQVYLKYNPKLKKWSKFS